MSNWRDYFVDLAHYHAWANAILFAALDKLTDEQRKADHGLFFRSIHHTVDHLLLVNQLWMGRLAGKPVAVNFKTIQIQDWDSLKTGLRTDLSRMAAWLANQNETWFTSNISFVSSNGQAGNMQANLILTHMFTHFNHHRGQVSAVITQLGGTAPEMDYFYYLRAKQA